MTTNNQKALIYCRVSTKKQEHDGAGLSSQEMRCRQYAASKHYDVVAIFHDAYSGGGDFMKRPSMRSLLEYVDLHPETNYVVIFDDLKRFARDLMFHWKLREVFRVRNVKPECLNFTFEETPEGDFIETIIAAHGQLERQQNKRQVIQKMKARLERGIYCLGGKAPYGYRYVKNNAYGGKILEIHKAEASIIKEVFKNFSTGLFFHMKDVAHFMNNHELRRKNKKLNLYCVKNILTNIAYAGYVEFKPWNVQRTRAIHPAIVSLETFELVQERLSGKLPQRTRRDMREDFPLRGYINCKYCHRPFTASWSTGKSGKKHPYYRCKTIGCLRANESIARNTLHAEFEAMLKSLHVRPKVQQYIRWALIKEFGTFEKSRGTFLKEYEKEVQELTLKIEGIVDRISFSNNPDLTIIYEKELSKLHNRRLQLQDKISNIDAEDSVDLEPLLQTMFDVYNNVYFQWKNGNYEDRKLVQMMTLNSNLEYARNEGLGTPHTSYVLRLFQEIGAINGKISNDVKIDQNIWNKAINELKQFAPYFKKEKRVMRSKNVQVIEDCILKPLMKERKLGLL